MDNDHFYSMSAELKQALDGKFPTRIIQSSGLTDEVMRITSHVDSISLAERVWLLRTNRYSPPSCPNGSSMKWIDGHVGYRVCGRATTCACARENHSTKISAAKKRMSLDEVKKANDRRMQTVKEKYGVDYISQDDGFRKRVEQTCVERFGSRTNLSSEETKAKIAETNLLKYDTRSPMQNKEVADRAKRTFESRYGRVGAFLKEKMVEKHGVRSALQKESFRQKFVATIGRKLGYTENDTRLVNDSEFFRSEWERLGFGILHQYGLSRQAVTYHLDRLGIPYEKNLTQPERIIADVLDTLGVQYRYRDRTQISPLELDFYVEDFRLAIEVCGLYWHSEAVGRGRMYHRQKLDLCSSAGIRLLTIFDDELENISIVRDRVAYAVRKSERVCHARDTTIRPISGVERKTFFDLRHIQGDVRASVALGAFKDDQLVAAMSFGGRRLSLGSKNETGKWELLRFATIGNIPGVASKIFRSFIKTYDPEEIVSYCDLRWGTGKVYREMGFDYNGDTSPGYWYVPPNDFTKRYHRFGFTKSKLIKEGFDASRTEKEIMQERGYLRVWDCGHSRWIWNR